MKNRDRVKERIVSIDFDGVLADYHGYVDESTTGSPLDGARQFIEKLTNSGFTPVIFTTRNIEIIEKWLADNDFPSIEVTNTKYPSVAYIDDRCIQFRGDYNQLYNKMKTFDVHWRDKNKKPIFDALNKE